MDYYNLPRISHSKFWTLTFEVQRGIKLFINWAMPCVRACKRVQFTVLWMSVCRQKFYQITEVFEKSFLPTKNLIVQFLEIYKPNL